MLKILGQDLVVSLVFLTEKMTAAVKNDCSHYSNSVATILCQGEQNNKLA